jgi:hypothetical protein
MDLEQVVGIAFRDEANRTFQAVLNAVTAKIIYRSFNSNEPTTADEFIGAVEVLLGDDFIQLVHTFPVGPFDSQIMNECRVNVLSEFSAIRKRGMLSNVGKYISSFAYKPYEGSPQYMSVSENA